MTFDAMSPFGITWGWIVLLTVPLLAVAWLTMALARRGDTRLWALAVLFLIRVVTACWAVFITSRETMVPIQGDPGGAYCVNDPWGDNPGFVIDWASDCGKALKWQLVTAGSPSVLVLGLFVWVALRRPAWKRTRKHPPAGL